MLRGGDAAAQKGFESLAYASSREKISSDVEERGMWRWQAVCIEEKGERAQNDAAKLVWSKNSAWTLCVNFWCSQSSAS